MARKKNRSKRRKAKASATQAPPSQDKRRSLVLLRNGAIAAAVLGVGGMVSVRAVRATISEQDLTQLGQGLPTVVQIHDPSCSLCTELQRNTRKALRAFDDDEIGYLVANIRTDDGAAFAGGFGVQHVTLLLFDGSGALQSTLEGVRDREELEGHFRTLIEPTNG